MTPREQIGLAITLVVTLLLTIFFGAVTHEPNERIASVLLIVIEIVFLVFVLTREAKERPASIG